MQVSLTLITLGIIGFTVALALAWYIPFSLLLYRLQRRHPKHYKNIGRPYAFLTSDDISLRNGGLRRKRGLAWFRYLSQLYKGIPSSFPNDTRCRHLAKYYRSAMRSFLLYVTMIILFVLPLEGIAFTVSREHTPLARVIPATSAQGGTDASSSTYTSLAGQALTQSSTTAPTQTTNIKKGQPVTMDSQASPSQGSAGVTTPVPVTAQLPKTNVPLTRADLLKIFSPIAPPGQSRPVKLDVCKQITSHSLVANDVGPVNGGEVCTDANLLTYSTY